MEQVEVARLVDAMFEESAVFLVRYALRRTRSLTVAEDVVQEAFLALYRDLRLGKPIQEPRAWMIGAVRNQICKWARANARHSEELFPSEKLDLMASERLTHQEAVSGDDAPLLLSILSPREKRWFSSASNLLSIVKSLTSLESAPSRCVLCWRALFVNCRECRVLKPLTELWFLHRSRRSTVHCSEEHLVSYLDGELFLFTRIWVRTHLQRCWKCRARLAASEREILRLTEAVDRWSIPGPYWKTDAKFRLETQFERIEASLHQSRPTRDQRNRTWAIAGAAGLLLCALLGWLSLVPQAPSPNAIDTIARATKAENDLFRPAVQETLSVVIEEIRPRRTARRNHLEAIADQATGRFTASLRSEDGSLKQALWRSDDGSEFVYQPSVGPTVSRRSISVHAHRPLVSIADSGLDPAQVEAAFMGWMETRSWRPISLAEDFAIWAHQDGTFLSLDRFQESTGEMVVRITAQRKDSRNGTTVWTLEIDANDYRPRLQTLRFKDRGREVEIRLFATNIREIPRAALMKTMFIPSGFLMRAPSESSYLTKSLPSGPLPEPASLTPTDKLRTLTGTVEALYALHQAGACLGASVQISESTRGVLISNRTNTGTDQLEVRATEATFGESLAALADIRNLTRGGGQTSDISRHTAALQLLAIIIHSNRAAALPDFSWRLLQTMFLDHTTMLSHQLEVLAPQSHIRATHTESAQPLFSDSATLEERLNNLAKVTEALEMQPPINKMPEIQAELYFIEAEYMVVCAKRRNAYRSLNVRGH